MRVRDRNLQSTFLPNQTAALRKSGDTERERSGRYAGVAAFVADLPQQLADSDRLRLEALVKVSRSWKMKELERLPFS